MNNAEMKVVPINGDVMTASGGSSETVWGEYTKALFWDFVDNRKPVLYLYNDSTGNPNTASLAKDTTVENIAFRLFQDNVEIPYMPFESQYVSGSTIGDALLSNLMNNNDNGIEYNGTYSFKTDGTKFIFTKN